MSEMPLTVKRSIELLGVVLIGAVLVIGSGIIMPILTAFFMSLLLYPAFRVLRRWRFPELLAIIIPILMVVVVVGLIGWFFSSQMGNLINDFPQIKKNVSIHLHSLSEWIGRISPYSTTEQTKFINDKSAALLNYAGGLASGAAVTLSSVFIFVGLLPIYIYLILFYKDILLRFIFMWFKKEDHTRVKDAIYHTESIVKSYLMGLLIQVTYMTILLGGTLMAFGINHALLIGIIFAILNLIPYVGALFGNIIGVLLTLTSSPDIWPVLTVLIIIAVVQFLDNNILMPRIVGSKIKINALVSIIGVVVGGSIAGVSGMFLSMPLIAVLKVVFDRTEMFKQWGVLLGDERPSKSPMSFPIFRKKVPVTTKEGVQKEA
ncbi:AI-2E family transporter [Pedobacter sp.]|uniref:AI-2E family transporter n=1 Tax=Pedobacter sp. TaxID=1411316 RepID=UPI003D7F90E8